MFVLKDEMTVNLIFANNLRDFRISIHRIGISDGSKQRLYIYIYKKLRKGNISFRSMYTLDSSKCHGMNMQASGSASGIRRNIFIRGQIYPSQQRFWYSRRNIFNLESLNHGETDSEVEIFV